MPTFVESFATILVLIIVILWLTHALNGSASDWLKSKFFVGDA